jgi:hypothetical protein
MTADSATCLAPAADFVLCRQPDPVPSRVAYHHPLTEFEKQQAELAAEEALRAPKGRFTIPPLPDIESSAAVEADGPTGRLDWAHASDVVYWVACLGGACLLLFCAIH